ncbi:hypothetical protein RYX36_028262 [Vicia faba]
MRKSPEEEAAGMCDVGELSEDSRWTVGFAWNYDRMEHQDSTTDWACGFIIRIGGVVAARSVLLRSDPRGSAKVMTTGELARDRGRTSSKRVSG